jgi:hypothetical protein
MRQLAPNKTARINRAIAFSILRCIKTSSTEVVNQLIIYDFGQIHFRQREAQRILLFG